MTSYHSGYLDDYREEELARLVLILVTPDPHTGASSTSNGSSCHAFYGTIAKDALLLVLEGIVQSSDAFPPLKSAASGLLFFASSTDVSIWAARETTTPDVHHLDRWRAAIRGRSAIFTSVSRASLHRSNAVRRRIARSRLNTRKPSWFWPRACRSLTGIRLILTSLQ